MKMNWADDMQNAEGMPCGGDIDFVLHYLAAFF